ALALGFFGFGALALLGRRWGGRSILHALFQGTNPLTQPLAQFGQLFGTENEQGNRENDNQVRRLKSTLKHRNLQRPHHNLLIRYRMGRGEVKPLPAQVLKSVLHPCSTDTLLSAGTML